MLGTVGQVVNVIVVIVAVALFGDAIRHLIVGFRVWVEAEQSYVRYARRPRANWLAQVLELPFDGVPRPLAQRWRSNVLWFGGELAWMGAVLFVAVFA